jgi:hypothetical protein
MDGAETVDFFGYSGCVRLRNERTSVVLGPHVGGRVLEYALDGTNALWLDPAQAGWLPSAGDTRDGPCGGRFDIGPEHIVPRRPALWVGPWNAEITGPRSARLTSADDASTGSRLVRDFELDASTSRLRCTQAIVNVSDHETAWCHWSRTFARGGGIGIVPLSPGSRFPRGYVMYGPGAAINFRPDDAHVRRRGDFVEIVDTPQFPKLGFDSYAGWFGYLLREGLLFVKRYPTYPDRVYNEIAGLTISIWYFQRIRCELEPIGPRERLKPGESASFSEEWELAPLAFPAPDEEVDLDAVARIGRGVRGA